MNIVHAPRNSSLTDERDRAVQHVADLHYGVSSDSLSTQELPVCCRKSTSSALFAQLPERPSTLDWLIHPSEITICKRPDGTPWLLGTGAFGQVMHTTEAEPSY